MNQNVTELSAEEMEQVGGEWGFALLGLMYGVAAAGNAIATLINNNK